MRSASYLRRQLELLAPAEIRPVSDDLDPLYAASIASARRRIDSARRELSDMAQRGDANLELTFDGTGVYGHSITFRRLEAVVPPLGQALRWTAHDQAILDGDLAVSETTLSTLAEPVLSGTFDGSFGILIQGAPVAEQYSLIHRPLFERTAERFLGIFRVARDTREPVEVIQRMLGLRGYAMNGYRKLGEVLTASPTPTRIRWRNEEVVTVTASVAATVVEALSSISTNEYDLTVFGRIVGADLPDERFHVEATDDDGRTQHHRGNVEPTLVSKLRGLPLGARARATMSITETTSDYLSRPRVSKVLTSVDLVQLDD